LALIDIDTIFGSIFWADSRLRNVRRQDGEPALVAATAITDWRIFIHTKPRSLRSIAWHIQDAFVNLLVTAAWLIRWAPPTRIADTLKCRDGSWTSWSLDALAVDSVAKDVITTKNKGVLSLA
jgi:hypothetical protein